MIEPLRNNREPGDADEQLVSEGMAGINKVGPAEIDHRYKKYSPDDFGKDGSG
jgi:hypothetical protein